MKRYERILKKIEKQKQSGFPLSRIVNEFYRRKEEQAERVMTEHSPVWSVYNDRKNEKLYMLIQDKDEV